QLLDHGAVALDRIHRYAGEAHALLDEAVPAPCVRGQLPVAVGSPIPAVEDEQNRSSSELIGKAPRIALVVRKFKVNCFLHSHGNRTARVNNSADLPPKGRESAA